MRRKFSFGKIACNGQKAKNNEVELEIELKKDNRGFLTFSAVGTVWNSRHTDSLMGGQCIDTMYDNFAELRNDNLFRLIYILWRCYHLNDLNAGSLEQTVFIREAEQFGFMQENNKSHYENACDLLDIVGLRIDSNGYEYGHSWLHRPIPDEVIAIIYRLLDYKDIISAEDVTEEMMLTVIKCHALQGWPLEF